MRQFEGYRVDQHIVLTHTDLKAENTEDQPNNVVPRNNGNAKLDSGRLNAVLPNQSFNVITLKKG